MTTKQPGVLTFEARGRGVDYTVTTEHGRHSSGPYDDKEKASAAAQAYADQNGIALPDLELAEGDRGAQQVQEF